jgi:uncharacterized protein YjiS (DUF1127 family)
MTADFLTRALLAHPAATAPTAVFDRIRGAFALWRSRGELAELDARLLRDIGVTADAAQREAARRPWDRGLETV